MYGQAVWSCPRDAGVNPRVKSPGGRWQKSPLHRGEHGAAARTIVQGMPDRFGSPVVTMLVCFFHLHARLRVRRAPGIPCALCYPRVTLAKPGRKIAPRECRALFFEA